MKNTKTISMLFFFLKVNMANPVPEALNRANLSPYGPYDASLSKVHSDLNNLYIGYKQHDTFLTKRIANPLLILSMMGGFIVMIGAIVLQSPDVKDYIYQKEFYVSPITISNVVNMENGNCRFNVESEQINYSQTVETSCDYVESTEGYFTRSDRGFISFTPVFYNFYYDEVYNDLVSKEKTRQLFLTGSISVGLTIPLMAAVVAISHHYADKIGFKYYYLAYGAIVESQMV